MQEKVKKSMFESTPKAIIYTFLMYFLAIAELSVLSGLRYIVPVPGGTNGADIGLTGSTKGYSLAAIGSQVGWQFVTMSILLFLAVLGFSFWMGFKRQIAGGATLVIMNLLPLVGLANTSAANKAFTFFWSYGTGALIPFMALFGLHTPADPNNRTGQIAFMVVFAVLTAIAWIAGKAYRKVYAEKYEFDLSVPLV